MPLFVCLLRSIELRWLTQKESAEYLLRQYTNESVFCSELRKVHLAQEKRGEFYLSGVRDQQLDEVLIRAKAMH